MPFCQTTPLLPYVTQQQPVTEYWCEGSTSTAIPTTFASVDRHNGRGGITFVAAHVVAIFGKCLFTFM